MADKLLIVMVNTDPSSPSELGAPFFQATVAAAMEYEVEVVMTGRAGELAKKGVAENLYVQEGSPKSVYEFMKDAHEAGVVFKVCTPTLDLWGDDLIPEIDETVGGAYVISQAMDDDTVTFTY
ncbi:Predicted peroxiredoxin [Ectothiorhodosinus mongolicus]|uniref:Predicted peroxiredoxin n=1 Tax=Ectothiorhodosinus mongolicus TaxID=233100 RepID=A0A1R3VNY7_9GAMM|nr:DsrE family protein [Ectothiorhodosinus mongolicus]ULX57800.1 peroxiredoxin [Ectothiorhodosinus mongolicus]SIT65665.1 Predicted peroxiredoxin [Ectothiorhodosinus mongolicus]